MPPSVVFGPQPEPTSCTYPAGSIEDQLRWLIEEEARAVNAEDIKCIQVIFAPDASITNGVNNKEHWNNPVDRYAPFFQGATIEDATHTDIRNLGINENVAYFTSASSGVVNGSSYNNPPGSDHWTFRKNPDGRWVIAKFTFNAAHLPFPPTTAASPTPSEPPEPTSCIYPAGNVEDQLRWLIEEEARAVNAKDIKRIQVIFAPDASIVNGANNKEHWNNPVDRYAPFFQEATIEGATHTDIRNLGINETVAYFTSASSGVVNGSSYNNPPDSDHWTFRKNPDSCWVIIELDFNASEVPFPPNR